MNNEAYLGRALNRLSADAISEHVKVREAQISQANAAGWLGSGRMLIILGEKALEVFNDNANRAVQLAYSVAGDHSEDTAGPLEFCLGRIEQGIGDNVAARIGNLGLSGALPANQLNEIRTNLQSAKERLMDDFRHGISGVEKLKKDSVVSAVINQSNSPGAVAQVGAGSFSQLAFTQQQHQLIEAVDQVLNSSEFAALDPEKQQGFRDVADVVKAEASKPIPDAGKLHRWGNTLVTFAADVGLKLGSSTIAQVLLKIFGG